MGILKAIVDVPIPFGEYSRLHYDPYEDAGRMEHVQDVEPILKRNRALASLNDGYSPSRELRRVASIPNVLIEKWLVEEGINVFDENDWPRVAAKLDDPAYAHLRTAPGRVSRGPVRETFVPRARPKPTLTTLIEVAK